MNRFLSEFQEQLFFCGITAGAKPLLALSGGVDSSVLFHLLTSSEIHFSAAHVNYGLRGEDSENDEELCREMCDLSGVTLHVQKAPENFGERSAIQERARNLRYVFFNELIAEFGYTHILTAHHANDSVETLFINLLRGTGIKGMKGIQSVSGKIIRPLLKFSKEELLKYAHENKVRYREDSSNEKIDYLRNRIRNHVILAIEKSIPGSLERITDSIEKISRDSDLLDFLTDSYSDRKSGLVMKEVICTLPEKLRAHFLFKFFQTQGINYAQAVQLNECIHHPSGKQIITSTHQIFVERDKFVAVPISIDEQAKGILAIDNLRIPGYRTEIRTADELAIIRDSSCAYLDADSLYFPLTWRIWKEGDFMAPLGMKGRKNISDILIDKKVELKDKKRIHVLCSGDKIVWLEGLRIADSSKINPQTTRVLVIKPENL